MSEPQRLPVVPGKENSAYNEAIANGHYIVVADNYLTVWLNGDPNDGYELHRDEDEWRWSEVVNLEIPND